MMSCFELAIETVLEHEGFYSNDPDDRGGPTKYGISLRYLKLTGQGDFNQDGDIDEQDVKQMTLQKAKQLYYKDWWVRYGYHRIRHQGVATKVFDLAVNMGAKQAHKRVQRAVWAVMGEPDCLQDDGILGPVTLKAINGIEGKQLLPPLRSEAAGFYRSLNQPKFLRGWLNRAYA